MRLQTSAEALRAPSSSPLPGRNPVVDTAIYLAIGAKFLFSATRSTIARRSLR